MRQCCRWSRGLGLPCSGASRSCKTSRQSIMAMRAAARERFRQSQNIQRCRTGAWHATIWFVRELMFDPPIETQSGHRLSGE